MRFYKCTNIHCCEQVAYREDKAKKSHYRCLRCMGRLEECAIQYHELKLGKFFEDNALLVNVLFSTVMALVISIISPSDFGGYIHSIYVQFIATLCLILVFHLGGYSSALSVLEKEPLDVENNLRSLKSCILASLGTALVSVAIIFN
ncbi:hypothetical protein N483_14205 [Pseudoalteromonas luteoviolacea NCIMB 1944]|uniref:Uncharacterized protein n=1 Tax=Pseudoalteromonas luteoviolacea (strain 2ta16) TaxID=1353533 RepID=V4J5H9_PSEL2|nr:hypothetical protein PL2TA16_01711 [Pseudoalteromonas luteoviolacea 2ta16]KZN41820.1 hypothetical protein N483_14205 [Pseudoalteromonas luteoviolacea NCIMB 1944]